mgnify:CR=1 FL=1
MSCTRRGLDTKTSVIQRVDLFVETGREGLEETSTKELWEVCRTHSTGPAQTPYSLCAHSLTTFPSTNLPSWSFRDNSARAAISADFVSQRPTLRAANREITPRPPSWVSNLSASVFAFQGIR